MTGALDRRLELLLALGAEAGTAPREDLALGGQELLEVLDVLVVDDRVVAVLGPDDGTDASLPGCSVSFLGSGVGLGGLVGEGAGRLDPLEIDGVDERLLLLGHLDRIILGRRGNLVLGSVLLGGELALLLRTGGRFSRCRCPG